MNTYPDRHSPESPEDHMARINALSQIAAMQHLQREESLVEEIDDLQVEIDHWESESQVYDGISYAAVRRLTEKLETAKNALAALRQQHIRRSPRFAYIDDPKLSAADRNSGRF